MMARMRCRWVLAALLWPGLGLAQEEGDSEEPADPSGWGEEEGWGEDGDEAGFANAPETSVDPTTSGPWSLGGFLRTQEALWVERLSTEPLAMARQTGELSLRYSRKGLRMVATAHGEIDPYYLLTERYDPDTRAEYGWQLRPDELYISGSTGPLELSVGRQTVAWGEGVLLSPVDRVAPRDLRDPGMTPLGDLRLPVGMLRASVAGAGMRLDVMGVFEADYGFETTPEGPFGLVPGVVAGAEVPQYINKNELLEQIDTAWTDEPARFGLSALQPYMRWSWRGRGIDLAVYGASLLDKQGVIQNPQYTESFFDLTELAIPLEHRRYWFAGLSGAVAPGPFVLRWELAADLGRPLNLGEVITIGGTEPEFNAIVVDRTVITPMAGFTWTGLDHTRVDVDVAQPILPDGTTNLTMPAGATQYAGRISYMALRDRLELAALWFGIGSTLEYGWIASGNIGYELADGVHAGLGYISYQPGSERGPLIGIDTHDRLFSSLRWDF